MSRYCETQEACALKIIYSSDPWEPARRYHVLAGLLAALAILQRSENASACRCAVPGAEAYGGQETYHHVPLGDPALFPFVHAFQSTHVVELGYPGVREVARHLDSQSL